jgi:SAM-dependent methyltransferase
MDTVLFVTHPKAFCGVYEYGVKAFEAIRHSKAFRFLHVECNSLAALKNEIARNKPAFVIYNYHPSVMPWLCTRVSKGIYRNQVHDLPVIQIGIIHEVTQEVANRATRYRNRFILGGSEKKLNSLFDYYIAPDPTLLLENPFVFKTGRLIPTYKNQLPEPELFTVGSFGFATPNKGFHLLIDRVQAEMDEAVIRLNIPFASFGDADGNNARAIAQQCKEKIHKKGIQLQVTHDFLDDAALLEFLSGNSINVFLYEGGVGRGLSSVLDYALAVHRPIAVSDNPMFRHVLNREPSICVAHASLKAIHANGVEALQSLNKEWSADMLCWEYNRILQSIKQRNGQQPVFKMGIQRKLKAAINKIITEPSPGFTWLTNTRSVTDDDLTTNAGLQYTPVAVSGKHSFNRILDDEARTLYQPAVDALFGMLPATMAKKLPRANVQQGFVFDTVYRFIQEFGRKPRMLCVGSYEDTASLALQKMGYAVDDIDPMVNYYLQEYVTKPTVLPGSYDIIFSTSVIEHDPDDASFMQSIETLLAPGGLAVITCDFKDGWKPGDLKPEVDARLYTQSDMTERLLKNAPRCTLVGEANWHCPAPDFVYLNKYNYTFATLTIRKRLA